MEAVPPPALKTPVAFLVFNRPDCTAAVLAEIRRARPGRLLVVADGPRPDRPGEAARCAEVRALIERAVDWPCEVSRNYSDINLGCRQRVASGLDWVFSQVEEAIILEDDVLPHPSFFAYCHELLARYRDDERVMLICGSKLFPDALRQNASYVFARYPLVWGWASWRRAWRHYDVEMSHWPSIRERGGLSLMIGDSPWTRPLQQIVEKTFTGHLNTWDTQLTLSCLRQSGLSVYPAVNLVSNIGFHAAATHTTASDGATARLPTRALNFPLIPPDGVFFDRHVEAATLRAITAKPSLPARLRAKLSRFTKRVLAAGKPAGDALTSAPSMETK